MKNLWKNGASAAAAAVIVAAAVASPASAITKEEHYPETPKLNPTLPIVNTTHGSDHIKANILNPHPVCNSGEDYRTVVYKVDDKFTPAGTISATNQSKNTIPLTQELSKTQTISISIKGDRTETTSVNLGGDVSGKGAKGSVGIAYELAKSMGAEASYSLSWNVGQTIGPYDVPAGQTGEATYGFRTINMTGTQQFCKANGTWSTPTFWSALTPVKNQVNMKLYGNPADSAVPAKPEDAEKPSEKPADDANKPADDAAANKPADDAAANKPADSEAADKPADDAAAEA
ncbi:hypothetical protein ACKFRT_06310 [Corynebacterium sp. YSMAA1_1_F7]|uniref:hypothetical protein n=1 Tax=Corynebacterium sp. YSMAA1_1_F7 TaxID=3383590 RepID=UPI0038D1DBE4